MTTTIQGHFQRPDGTASVETEITLIETGLLVHDDFADWQGSFVSRDGWELLKHQALTLILADGRKGACFMCLQMGGAFTFQGIASLA